MTDTLAAEFAAHANEALAVANETFDAADPTFRVEAGPAGGDFRKRCSAVGDGGYKSDHGSRFVVR